MGWEIHWLWRTLADSLSLWEGVEYAGTILVILGVIGEYLAEFRKIPKDEVRRKRFEKSCATVLIIGLSAELLGLVRTSQLNGKLIAALNYQAQQATKDAAIATQTAKGYESQIASANDRAKAAEAIVATANSTSQAAIVQVRTAEARIAEANAKAAEAKKVAESERLERVKIEERLRPRALNQSLLPEARNHLRKYAGTPYELSVDATPESIQLLAAIDTLLRDSNWTAKKSDNQTFRSIYTLPSGSQVDQGVFAGVIVRFNKSKAPQLQTAAEQLVIALRSLGIDNAHSEYLPEDDPSPNNIHILVGPKE